MKEQIEEMAQVIGKFMYKDCDDVPFNDMRAVYESVCKADVISCACCKAARGLTDAGYRKQSEGKFILFKPRRENRNATYRCSVCGKLCSSYYNDVGEWKFCPHCGAHMKGEK